MILLRNRTFFVFSIVSVTAIILFESIRLYTIIGSILIIVLYMAKSSIEFKQFMKETWYAFVLLLIAFLVGVFAPIERFWCGFEAASIVLMILYSIVVFIKLYIDKEVKKDTALMAITFYILGIILLVLSVCASIGQGIDIRSGNGFGVQIDGARGTTMGILVLGTVFYAAANYVLSQGESAYKTVYIKSLQYSDIPVAITFSLLWASTHILKDSDPLQYDAFYGGVIAFQMLYSNIIWSFIDKPIFEIMLNKSKE